MQKITTDRSTIKCRECGETKTRFLDGKYPAKKDKRWVDEAGKEFNGHECPPCHSENVRKRKARKAKRDNKKD